MKTVGRRGRFVSSTRGCACDRLRDRSPSVASGVGRKPLVTSAQKRRPVTIVLGLNVWTCCQPPRSS